MEMYTTEIAQFGHKDPTLALNKHTQGCVSYIRVACQGLTLALH